MASTKKIKISLTEFIKFVNKSGSPKTTVVKEIIKSRDREYVPGQDYWSFFREKLTSHLMDESGEIQMDDVMEEIPADRGRNYRTMINGWKSFAGKKKFKWIDPPVGVWNISDLSISVNPEIAYEYRGRIYVVKMHLSVSDELDKMHSDQIRALMESVLREKVGGDEVIFGVLDVRRGKLFDQKSLKLELLVSLTGEALNFESQWKGLKKL